LVYKELEKIVKEGPMQKDLDKAVKNMLKERQENKAHNGYWMNALYTLHTHGYNPDDESNFEDILNSISVKDVQKVMKKLYKDANVVDITFSPKESSEGV
jgi:zinc protease